MKRIILLTVVACLSVMGAWAQEMQHNARYPDDPAFTPVADSLKGLIIKGEFSDSKIYPETRREWQVYVPVQYDGITPACLLVGLDGILFNATTVMDNLIASGQMPVTIGVFVQPGVSYDSDGNVLRYNRSNEFDRTDGTFARFLETEILPMVESLVTEDGRPVRLSHNPDDRAITGASSSGICAFTTAWERPDLFHRVYSSVGTYVAMRGGNDYPAYIRKCEPKPVRIFLQDGMKDAWNPLFGEWWEQNLLMESALDFAGYEETAHWDRGGHSIWHGTRMFPDAMRWLWKGWPAPVVAGESRNDMLQSLLGKGKEREEGWREIARKDVPADVLKRLEHPVTRLLYPSGKLEISVEGNSNWLRSALVMPDGRRTASEQFYWLHNPDNHLLDGPVANDLAFDTLGNLYAATPFGVQICDQNGRVRAILTLSTRRIDALCFSGNTLHVLSCGRIFVRNLKHKAWNPSDGFITPPSQGQG
jgi:Enterochelin esterase and related enzymes